MEFIVGSSFRSFDGGPSGFEPSGFPQCPPQQELNLPVQAPKLGVGPALQGFVRFGLQAEQECFPLRH
jgi:hypothetical protein